MASKDQQRVIRSEDVLAQKTDLCISNAIVKTGIGFGTGVVLSVLLFRRRSFPVWLSTGFGIGSSYTDCQRSFNPLSVPGVRVVPSSSSEAASKSQPTSFEKLQQKAGELVGTSREKVEEKKSEYLPQVKKGLEQVKGKGEELKEKVEEKFPIHSTNETSTSSPQDCFSCRLTGTLAFAGLGGYSLLEAYRLLNPTSKSNPNPLTSATSAPTSTPTSSTSNAQKNINEVNKKILKSVGGKGGSRLHAGALVVFGLACLGAGSVRWSK